MLRFLTVVAALWLIDSPAFAGELERAGCFLNGFETPVQCVRLRVPLDYDRSGSKNISVAAAIVPATTAKPDPVPLIVLAGGPGQAATDMAPWLNSAFKPAR